MDTKEYAMGVAHSVNVETLVREVFRKVAHQIVERTAEKITPPQQVVPDK
jgi:hypothetical protein